MMEVVEKKEREGMEGIYEVVCENIGSGGGVDLVRMLGCCLEVEKVEGLLEKIGGGFGENEDVKGLKEDVESVGKR